MHRISESQAELMVLKMNNLESPIFRNFLDNAIL